MDIVGKIFFTSMICLFLARTMDSAANNIREEALARIVSCVSVLGMFASAIWWVWT